MKIDSLEAVTVSIPLDKPLAFATRRVDRREYTLVRARTRDGLEGWGYCYSGERAGRLVTAFVRDFFASHVVGEDPRAVEALWERMYGDAVLLGRRGAAMRALSAVDVALWDLVAKGADLPLYRLLGGKVTDRVPCYASGGYYWQDQPPEAVADEVAAYAEAGFDHVKIKVGRLGHEEEIRRAVKAREAIGPDIRLMMDANNAWPDATTAIFALRGLARADPFWIEEPLMPDDVRGHATIRASIDVPVATGEIEATRWGFGELLEHDAVDVLQPDATVLGGITEFRKVAAIAAGKSVPLYPHWMHHLNASLVAAFPNAVMVEYFCDLSVLNIDRIIADPVTAKAGELEVSQEPGIGVRFDDEAVARLSIDQWG